MADIVRATDELQLHKQQQHVEQEEEDLKCLILPDISCLPISPPSAVETNFVRYFALDFMKPGHDQYVYRHANGLCVIGLAPTHVALKVEGGVTSVDFNVGKSDRSEFKVTGKRKKVVTNILTIEFAKLAFRLKICSVLPKVLKLGNRSLMIHASEFHGEVIQAFFEIVLQNAQHFQPTSILCNVHSGDTPYVIRCCVKGSLLEVNNRLMHNPGLLNTSADRDGYVAIVMPKPADWLKIKGSLVTFDDFTKLRKLA